MQTFFLFLIGVLLGSCGAILFKVGAVQLEPFSWKLDWLLSSFFNPSIFFGFILYFIPALIWIYLLSKYPVSFVQPILALTYVATPLLAMFFIKEPIPLMRWLGILIIIAGVFVVSRSN